MTTSARGRDERPRAAAESTRRRDHMDTDRIKRRIRGLLNLAANDAASEGEIDNAMRMAAQLMDEHHLSEADARAAQPQAERREQPMGQADAPAAGAKWSTWESALASAVGTLVGSVKCYRCHAETKSGMFGAPRRGVCIRFYGPADDAQLAAELFSEWSHVIASMAVGKYGGCFRGDGAMYAYGFACQLRNRAQEADVARAQVSTTSTRALVHVGGGGTLAQVLEGKRAEAGRWLASQGVKLATTSRRAGYSSGSHDAYGACRADGARADFSANRRAKLN